MSTDRRACEGADTISTRMGCEHAQECAACGRKVRDDMVDHPFFGFAASGCASLNPAAKRPEPQGEEKL